MGQLRYFRWIDCIIIHDHSWNMHGCNPRYISSKAKDTFNRGYQINLTSRQFRIEIETIRYEISYLNDCPIWCHLIGFPMLSLPLKSSKAIRSPKSKLIEELKLSLSGCNSLSSRGSYRGGLVETAFSYLKGTRGNCTQKFWRGQVKLHSKLLIHTKSNYTDFSWGQGETTLFKLSPYAKIVQFNLDR